MQPEQQPPLVRSILSFYLEHPTLVETNEGLARWRLLEERIDRTLRETQEALDWLVANEYLRQIPRRGSSSVFMMNHERWQDARRFVEPATEGTPRGQR